MRILVTAMLLSALVSCAGVAAAGVVLQEQQVITRASGTWKADRTVSIEGRKGRVASNEEALVVDFDQPRTLIINLAAKSYYVTPFPPPRLFGFLITRATVPPMVNYQKTGKRRTIAGYQCDEYSGSRKFETVTYSDVVCFSTQAPGAKEYDAFKKGLIVKLDPDRQKPLSKLAVPDGIPLQIQATIIMGLTPPPPKSKQQATPGASTPATPKPVAMATPKARPSEQKPGGGYRTQVLTITMSSVKEQVIAPDEFATPAGFKKVRPPMFGLGR